MGLSTASVRHSHVMVMAPALTKTSQRNFDLPPHSPSTQSTTPIQGRDDCMYQSYRDCNLPEHKEKENLKTLALVSELLKTNSDLQTFEENGAKNHRCSTIMNNSPPHMGDQPDDTMGLQKALMDVSPLNKDKTAHNDMEQLFNNLPAADIGQMDEIIQVIKSIENADKTGNDLCPETESVFLSASDLTSNLSSFEKDLLNDVDVMNITMEEPFLESVKENPTKELVRELEEKQIKLQRRLEFVLRRLRKAQARHMGQHVSEEVAGIFEHVHRTLRRAKENIGDANHTERLKPISQSSAKNLVRKLEMSANMQANASGKRQVARYFGSGSLESSSLRSALMGAIALPQWTPECKNELQKVVGSLHAETKLLQEEIDSDATVSSSGGESCDEMQAYNNSHQHHLTIQKRAAWRYSTERAAIASKWAWLQAQIPDLEYRIRQYSDLHKQIRLSKGAVQLAGSSPPRSEPTSPSAVNGYRGQLPGASPISLKTLETAANVPQAEYSCSRTRPLVNFRKRKLLQTWGLHAVSKKAARSSTVRCGCVPPSLQCALCTGRTDPTRPRDLPDYLSKSERIALLDPGFHPVFSLTEDISASTHLDAIMKTAEWQLRSTRSNLKSVKFVTKTERIDKNNIGTEHQPKKQLMEHRKKYSRLLKSSTINALTAKLKHKFRGQKQGLHSLSRLRRKMRAEKMALAEQLDLAALESSNEELDTCGVSNSSVKTESRSSSPLLSMQSISGYKRSNRISSYDIDNIVIPYSIAASTRVEKLQYKEILTPKWRIVDPDFALKFTIKNNGSVRDGEHSDSDTEDFSEEAMIVRHDKCEQEERKRFLSYLKFPYGYSRPRSHKRTDSRAESSGCNSPDPMSPQQTELIDNAGSPLASPPATPLSATEEPLPSLSILRRRTLSQSLRGKDKEVCKEEIPSTAPDTVEVIPYERRFFPLNEETYERMLESMPENHQFKTNIRSQDCISPMDYFDDEAHLANDSESTESAYGDEDPNDPEWIDMETIKERYRR